MGKEYLVFDEGIWIWQNPQGGVLYTPTKLSYNLNNDAIEILKYCNGKNTLDDIIELLRKEGRTLTLKDIENIRKFIYNLINMKILQVIPSPVSKEILIVGSKKVFTPIHCTVELTNACNLKCNYCYNEADNSKRGFLRSYDVFFTNLLKQGIRVVELSGGEPLLHPEIHDILEFTCEKFTHVALLTNGLLLDDNILEPVEKFARKLTLQVSIPTMKPDRFREITGVDAWDIVYKNLIRLRSYNLIFRIAMVVVDEKSVGEVREMAIFAKSLGAKMFGVVPFMPLGRAKSLPPIPAQSLILFANELEKLNKELPNFVGIIEGDFPDKNARNCGAGSRTIVFDYQGESRPCALFPLEFSRLKVHTNLFIRQRLAEIISPREEVCGGCSFINFCRGCLLRGWLKFTEINCEWGKSQKISEVFSSVSNG